MSESPNNACVCGHDRYRHRAGSCFACKCQAFTPVRVRFTSEPEPVPVVDPVRVKAFEIVLSMPLNGLPMEDVLRSVRSVEDYLRGVQQPPAPASVVVSVCEWCGHRHAPNTDACGYVMGDNHTCECQGRPVDQPWPGEAGLVPDPVAEERTEAPSQNRCPACWHLLFRHGILGCSHSAWGEKCPCRHTPEDPS